MYISIVILIYYILHERFVGYICIYRSRGGSWLGTMFPRGIIFQRNDDDECLITTERDIIFIENIVFVRIVRRIIWNQYG